MVNLVTAADRAALDELERLPGSLELPDSDDTPVDNEGQNDIPNGLRLALSQLWHNRQDWFFGVDMGIYDRQGQHDRKVTIVPDGFLSLGVVRRKGQYGRSSYVLAEENNIVPTVALEYLSKTYGGEYDSKLAVYAQLGVPYYVVYNPEGRRGHQRLEMYHLERGNYQLQQTSEPFWIPEIELGIGRVQGILSGIPMEWLTWFDHLGQAYPLPEEVIETLRVKVQRQQGRIAKLEQLAQDERSRAEMAEFLAQQERSRAEMAEALAQQERLARLQLIDRLKQMGIDSSLLDN